jgi:hypothetical protein
MTIEELRALIKSGKFHHATYRNQGTLWEGLWIYQFSTMGRGFEPVACFAKNDPNLAAAEELVRKFGTSLGSYGNG